MHAVVRAALARQLEHQVQFGGLAHRWQVQDLPAESPGLHRGQALNVRGHVAGAGMQLNVHVRPVTVDEVDESRPERLVAADPYREVHGVVRAVDRSRQQAGRETLGCRLDDVCVDEPVHDDQERDGQEEGREAHLLVEHETADCGHGSSSEVVV